MKKSFLIFSVAFSVIGGAQTAAAALVLFDSRVSFSAATAGTGTSLTETFELATTDTPLSTDSLNPTLFSGFSAYYTGNSSGPSFTAQQVDVSPFTSGGAFFPGGSSSAYLAVLAAEAGNPINNLSSQTYVQLDTGTTAFGFDYGQWGDSGNMTEMVVTTNSGTYMINPRDTDPENGFLGLQFVGGEFVTDFTWTPITGGLGLDAIGVDNFTTVNTVPIPAALPLFLSALGGLGFFGWRRKLGRVIQMVGL